MLINYICFLNNPPTNLTEIDLGRGFKIRALAWDDAIDLLKKLDAQMASAPIKTLEIRLDEEVDGGLGAAIVILNHFEADLRFDQAGNLTAIPDEVSRFQEELVDGYLTDQIAKMRLFREGNVSKMASMMYYMDGKVPRLLSVSGRISVSGNPYTSELSEQEVNGLQTFLDRVELPFEYPFLRLAHDIYERSYDVDSEKVVFILLMRGMDALFGRGTTETTYSVSRNAAVLLGTVDDRPESIFNQMMNLGRKLKTLMQGREESKKVSRRISKGEVLYLRSLVRRGIIKANDLGMDKDALMSLLNRSKF